MNNQKWFENEDRLISLYKLTRDYMGPYDRDNWILTNAFSPIDIDTNDSKLLLQDICDDLSIEYDDIFSVGSIEFKIKDAISIQDNRQTPKNVKDFARNCALIAGFISQDDLDFINLLDNQESTLNFNIINGKLTPEQLFDHIDNPLALNKLMLDFPKYHKKFAIKKILENIKLSLKDLPKKVKEELRNIQDLDSALHQFKAVSKILIG